MISWQKQSLSSYLRLSAAITASIVSGLQGVPGIEIVEVDKDNKMVTVSYDTDYTDETQIRHKMRDIGYEAVG